MLEFYIISVILTIGSVYFACMQDYKFGGYYYMPNTRQLFTIIVASLLPVLNLIVLVSALFYILSDTDN